MGERALCLPARGGPVGARGWNAGNPPSKRWQQAEDRPVVNSTPPLRPPLHLSPPPKITSGRKERQTCVAAVLLGTGCWAWESLRRGAGAAFLTPPLCQGAPPPSGHGGGRVPAWTAGLLTFSCPTTAAHGSGCRNSPTLLREKDVGLRPPQQPSLGADGGAGGPTPCILFLSEPSPASAPSPPELGAAIPRMLGLNVVGARQRGEEAVDPSPSCFFPT